MSRDRLGETTRNRIIAFCLDALGTSMPSPQNQGSRRNACECDPCPAGTGRIWELICGKPEHEPRPDQVRITQNVNLVRASAFVQIEQLRITGFVSEKLAADARQVVARPDPVPALAIRFFNCATRRRR